MPFIQANCANCGAHLLLDNTRNTATCPSCGTSYLISNNSYSQNNSSSDFVIVGGELKKNIEVLHQL